MTETRAIGANSHRLLASDIYATVKVQQDRIDGVDRIRIARSRVMVCTFLCLMLFGQMAVQAVEEIA